MAFDGLAHFARGAYGEPIACDGAVLDEFDGVRFGRLTLSFDDGVTLEVQTMPPEASVITLSHDAGFDDVEEVRALLRDYASERGLSIDWTTPEVTAEGDDTVHSFWDPDSGLNGSAALILRDDRLIGVRLSMAL
jgi:hypothetical protein